MNKVLLIALSSVLFSHESVAMEDPETQNYYAIKENSSTYQRTSKKSTDYLREQEAIEKQKSVEKVFDMGIREYKKKNNESYKEALNYFGIAASSGHDGAQNALGVFYENGLGIPRNFVLAKKWYGEAAKNGNTNARESVERLSEIEDYYQYKLFGIW